ncbi:hypothetical protein HMPREF0262_01109 [Clostridium sp. ATCC 29733]|nr:hypothetical protein HMPREF0262_01109 [Clostridium sp. ATCC 29733]
MAALFMPNQQEAKLAALLGVHHPATRFFPTQTDLPFPFSIIQKSPLLGKTTLLKGTQAAKFLPFGQEKAPAHRIFCAPEQIIARPLICGG